MFRAWRHRENNNSIFGYVVGVDINPVKAIAKVDFDEVDGTMPGVGKEDFAKDAIEGMSKLHHLNCHKRQRVHVDSPPPVVAYPPWPLLVLRDYPGQGKPQVG